MKRKHFSKWSAKVDGRTVTQVSYQFSKQWPMMDFEYEEDVEALREFFNGGLSIMDAIHFGSTPQGHTFWQDLVDDFGYYVQDLPDHALRWLRQVLKHNAERDLPPGYPEEDDFLYELEDTVVSDT